jgi:hypothetical protein
MRCFRMMFRVLPIAGLVVGLSWPANADLDECIHACNVDYTKCVKACPPSDPSPRAAADCKLSCSYDKSACYAACQRDNLKRK